MTDKNIKVALITRDRLSARWNWLLSEYRELQKYFANRTPAEAETRFYCEKFEDSGEDAYGEGRFSLGHRSLAKRMIDNRVMRNALAVEIRVIKLEIKRIQKHGNN